MEATNNLETQRRATATSGEDKIRELVRGEAARVLNRDGDAEMSVDAIASLLKKLAPPRFQAWRS